MVLNIADMRTRHSREAFDSLRQHFDDKLFETTIRSSIAYAESAERAQSILDYRPDLAVDYLECRRGGPAAPGYGRAAPPAEHAGRVAVRRPGVTARYSSRTSAPWDSKGTRTTAAQPSASRWSASTTGPVCSY